VSFVPRALNLEFLIFVIPKMKKNLVFKIHNPLMSYSDTIEIATKSEAEIVNITQHVNAVVKRSKIKDGSLTVFTPHTTTAITVNEDESRLIKDIRNKILQLVPKGGGYHHDGIDGNAHSHILASIIGCSVVLPVMSGSPALGTWQSILFIELDGPRNRKVIVQIG
jgi:secondary thiamine-phosphate synthase enzyme